MHFNVIFFLILNKLKSNFSKNKMFSGVCLSMFKRKLNHILGWTNFGLQICRFFRPVYYQAIVYRLHKGFEASIHASIFLCLSRSESQGCWKSNPAVLFYTPYIYSLVPLCMSHTKWDMYLVFIKGATSTSSTKNASL